jgi:putative transposase
VKITTYTIEYLIRGKRGGNIVTHSYRVYFFHLVWSTKNREPWIDSEVKERLYKYLSGIARKYDGSIVEIGGMPDHIHMLLRVVSSDKFSYLIRGLKASSSLWVHKAFPNLQSFAWQEGYSSFTVSYSSLERAREYIKNQEEHHKSQSFDDEYRFLLRSHDVIYDEKFVLG